MRGNEPLPGDFGRRESETVHLSGGESAGAMARAEKRRGRCGSWAVEGETTRAMDHCSSDVASFLYRSTLPVTLRQRPNAVLRRDREGGPRASPCVLHRVRCPAHRWDIQLVQLKMDGWATRCGNLSGGSLPWRCRFIERALFLRCRYAEHSKCCGTSMSSYDPF